jgi:UDPglucose--hexose-1-phosphate uridylyltransferase
VTLFLGELRKDYFLERWVVIEPARAKRPSDFQKEADEIKEGLCYFCPGNEHLTPPSIYTLVLENNIFIKKQDSEEERVKDWTVRVFPNKFPIMSPEPNAEHTSYPTESEPAYGYHYVVVPTPKHEDKFVTFSKDQWIIFIEVLRDMAQFLYGNKVKGVGYVSIFINNGKAAGASIKHPHAQIVTTQNIPPIILNELMAYKKQTIYERCAHCSIIRAETGGPRHIFSTKHFMSVAPWASFNPYEFWIYPIRHETKFSEINSERIEDLATMLRIMFGALGTVLGDVPFNMVFHISPEKKTTKLLHWHIEVYPRLTTYAGLELGSGIYVNPVPPEQACSTLAVAARKEYAKLYGVE